MWFKRKSTLIVTKAGLQFLDSPDYELQMVALSAHYWQPDKSFYELLLAVTAMHLSQIESFPGEPAAFRQFINENISTIRSAINRVKKSHPAIALSEEDWERDQRALNQSETKPGRVNQEPKVFVVSDEAAIVEVIPKLLNHSGCEAIGSLSIRAREWVYAEVLSDAKAFQPNVLLLCYNCHSSPIVDGKDLPSLLLDQFPRANLIITRVGDCVSVRATIIDELKLRGRHFEILDVPFEVTDILKLLRPSP